MSAPSGACAAPPDNDYTAGVICAKVARYAERVHSPNRLTRPLVRKGPKGSGEFAPISWDDALDLVAEKFLRAEQQHGAEAVWPYYYAGTMGHVMRDGINRLRHVKKYSNFHETICNNPAWVGFAAGTGLIAGPDPREMAKSDLVVIWGTNAVNTQVNVMTHAVRARKERGAKIVAVDVYMNGTMEQADLPVMIRPGHRRRARLRGHALPVPRRQGRLGLSRPLHRRAARTGRARAPARPAMGGRDHRLRGRYHRGVRARSSARPSARSSAWATASRARATAPPTCTRQAAFPRSPAPGCTKGEGRSTTTARSITSTRP